MSTPAELADSLDTYYGTGEGDWATLCLSAIVTLRQADADRAELAALRERLVEARRHIIEGNVMTAFDTLDVELLTAQAPPAADGGDD